MTKPLLPAPHEQDGSILGIDMGGANLKVADVHGNSRSCGFPMWRQSSRLAERLREMLGFPGRFNRIASTRLAVTLTGELADCFATRREGVRFILDQLATVFPEHLTNVYAVGGNWLSPEQAKQDPWAVAASNWYALAQWIIQSGVISHCQPNLIVDIGSTTVDIIPIHRRQVATEARTDRQRLQLGQLVYTGLQRTPVAAILSSVELGGELCPVMAERFATSDDAYLVLGYTQEVPADLDTADGRGRTRPCARARLARMVGEDSETLSQTATASIATQIVDAQAAQVASAINRNLSTGDDAGPAQILVSGHGRALARLAQRHLARSAVELIWLEDYVSEDAARCAPALAVAWLLSQRQMNHTPEG